MTFCRVAVSIDPCLRRRADTEFRPYSLYKCAYTFYFRCQLLFLTFYYKIYYNKYRKWQFHKRGFAKSCFNKPLARHSRMVYFFYLCSCLSTQFLYRTVVKATFNVKENINDIIKNSITLTINITTFLRWFVNWWQNLICLLSFPMSISIAYCT